MDYYHVAKTKESGFIGQFPLEEINKRFHAGDLLGTYVATKAVASYHQLMKSGTAAWITVADLVADPPAQHAETASDLSGNTDVPSSAIPADTRPSGVIPGWGINRAWFTAGVIIGGLMIAAGLQYDKSLGIGAPTALISGLTSAAAFLFCFDKSGNFRWLSAVPAIGVVVIGANALHLPVFGGVLGYFFFTIMGYAAVLVRHICIGIKRLILAITGFVRT